MQITSSLNSDIRSAKASAGGYEWWYFDAVDEQNTCRFVVIFYEGNPFSPRYIRALNTEDDDRALPRKFPAVSISVYKDGAPVYYSFTEFSTSEARFESGSPALCIGKHKMKGGVIDGKFVYKISLEEVLPSGDAIQAEFTFESPEVKHDIFAALTHPDEGHSWNLVQPRAEIHGNIRLDKDNKQAEDIRFRGTGYHDHNLGQEPMRNEFDDWYWGRFHFKQSTLVYYVMNRKARQQHQAWLISDDNSRIIQKFDNIHLQDKGLTVFGLNSARRIVLSSEEIQVTIQQTRVSDNGPFYQRFASDAFLVSSGQERPEATRGISEYIRPNRIYWRLFWPLVNMRIRFNDEQPHWVQKSKTLYRWTW